MAMLSVGGVAIKTPSEFQVEISDVDGESYRNANGELIRDRVGVKRKLNMKFPPMTQSEMSTLLNAITAVFFTVNYPDPMEGQVTKTFYVGNRTAPVYKYGTSTSTMLWENVAFNFIEQ